MKNRKHVNQRSCDLLKIATPIIPGLTQTFSKGPQVYGFSNDVPHYIQKSLGVFTYDVDNNCYIDYSMGLGSVILGHAYPEVIDAVYRTICDGNSHSLMHPLEIEVSKKVLEICGWADMVRFGKNGSDTTTAAVRLARAYTGKKYIAVASNYDNGTRPYHGWHDWSAALSDMNAGIPNEIKNLTLTFEFNNSNSLLHLIDCYNGQIACIVMEGAKFVPPTKDFVTTVNEISAENNICLIIDETLNGLRMYPGGAHERFSYKPDLVTFGKSFGNGFPLSILVGKKKIMSLLENILFTMTYGGETSSLAAADMVIDIYRKNDVFNRISRCGKILKNSIQDLLIELNLYDRFLVMGMDTRFCVYPVQKGTKTIDNDMALLFRKSLFNNGILCAGVHNIALLHDENIIEKTIWSYKKALKEMLY